ncbi:ACP S-malonyltransferase [Krasilnikovia sp. M28-CT-15]|uniref:ACP S-malonyltransferase n=1 Tax=Krasilnikovia sp. M28-CT-15 TaxID=3373540 RepID=UPI003876F782
MSDAVFFPGLVPANYGSVADFILHSPYARRRYAEVGEILGYDLVAAFRDASINDSEVFQQAFLALYLALTDLAEQRSGLRAALTAGQSFGGLVAAVYAGALSLADSTTLIHRSTRHEVAYFASLPVPVGCFFFGGLSRAQVSTMIDEFADDGRLVELSVEFDNGISAVSATMPTIDLLKTWVADRGGRAFHTLTRAEHCPSVAPLRELVSAEYDRFTWRECRIPLVSDIDGSLLRDGETVKVHLLDGWVAPARWSTITDGLTAGGARRVYVVGPRTMFGRVTKARFETVTLSPRRVMTEMTAAQS